MRALLNRFRRARPAVEPLEPRVVPSYVPAPGAASTHGGGCACPGCAAPAEYRIGGTGSASTAGGYKWHQASLGSPLTITYSYSNLLNGRLTGGMSAATLKAVIREALGRWAAVAPLRFVEVADSGPTPSKADYAAAGRPMMRFGHLPIDGRYNVLAYGYYPGGSGLAGDVLFDTSEPWTLNPASGIDLLEVATHEIGHALGLDHQPAAQRVAVMNPLYAGRFRGLGTSFLHADDIAGVRALYGVGVGSVTALGVTLASAGGTPAPDPAFVVSAGTLSVYGTPGDDTFRYAAGAVPSIEINGRLYAGSLAGVTTVRFDGRGGADVLAVAGGARAETFTLSAGTAFITGGAHTVVAAGMRTVAAAGGAGDRLVLNGTAAKDAFTASPSVATLTTGVVRVIASGFSSAALNGDAADQATLTGSAGDDTFTASPAGATLAGPGYSLSASGFGRVDAV
ncbi:MAG: matrixin family metalloprotease, partial [Gemmataceae bacterium]